MRFELVDNGMGCCVLCRGPIFGKAVVAGGFDFICETCAKGIAGCVEPEPEPPVAVREENAEAHTCTCPLCGREFQNKGALLAHRRYCKAKASESSASAEGGED